MRWYYSAPNKPSFDYIVCNEASDLITKQVSDDYGLDVEILTNLRASSTFHHLYYSICKY